MKIKGSIIAINIFAWGVIGLAWLIPILGIFMASIRPFSEIVSGWWNFTELHIGFENYSIAFSKGMGRYLFNTIIISVPTTLLACLIASLAAYGFSRFSFSITNIVFIIIVFMQTIPRQMILIPIFTLLQKLHLIDTFFGIILVHTGFELPWLIFFLRAYFSTMPRDLEDAAKIDGCGYFQTFFRIVLPTCIPAIVSVASIQFVWIWNDLLFSLIFLSSKATQPISVGLTKLKGAYYVNWSLLSASAIIASIIPVFLFLLLQKYFLKGIMSGAIKG